MKHAFIVVSAISVLLGVGAVLADADAIAQRRALMKSNGEAAKDSGGMLKGAPFDLAAAQDEFEDFR